MTYGFKIIFESKDINLSQHRYHYTMPTIAVPEGQVIQSKPYKACIGDWISNNDQGKGTSLNHEF